MGLTNSFARLMVCFAALQNSQELSIAELLIRGTFDEAVASAVTQNKCAIPLTFIP